MADPYARFRIDTRPTDALTTAQVSLLRGIESVLRDTALVLVCPRCAADGRGLETNNALGDPQWKIDCLCRRRRTTETDVRPMPASGWLLAMAEEMLSPLGLAVRCPSPVCLLTPLKIRQSETRLQVICPCNAERVFRKEISRAN